MPNSKIHELGDAVMQVKGEVSSLKEWLERKYTKENKSANIMARILRKPPYNIKISNSALLHYMSEYGILIRKRASNSKIRELESIVKKVDKVSSLKEWFEIKLKKNKSPYTISRILYNPPYNFEISSSAIVVYINEKRSNSAKTK